MKLNKSEISFIIRRYDKSFSSLMYDTIPHSNKGIHYIDKNTKLAILQCTNEIREQVYDYAKTIGAFDDIIWIQPQVYGNKLLVHGLLSNKIKQPETKLFLDPEDNLSDQLIKPRQGYQGKGIYTPEYRFDVRKFYQKRLNKVREFRVIQCSWFTDDSQVFVHEKLPNKTEDIVQNQSSGGSIRYYDYASKNIEDGIINQLIHNTKIVLTTLGLDYASCDFVIDDNDDMQFLECNIYTNYANAAQSHIDRPNVKYYGDQHLNLFNNLFDMEYEQLKCLKRDITI